MIYNIKEDFSTSECRLRVLNNLQCFERLSEAKSVFLHSANYKFSLGSGSSMMVQQIIDGEKQQHGVSQVEKAILKIKKTPICGVQLTSGGNLPQNFELPGPGGKLQTCLNYDWIVHAVIPGPRIDDFETKVEKMIADVLLKIKEVCADGTKIDFIMPVVGVNNFGYPFEFMWKLYLKLLKNCIIDGGIIGKIFILLRKQHIDFLLENKELLKLKD